MKKIPSDNDPIWANPLLLPDAVNSEAPALKTLKMVVANQAEQKPRRKKRKKQ